MDRLKLFEEIAKEYLFIDTLETRGSDRLDFHEVSVWSLVDASERIYEEGKKSR